MLQRKRQALVGTLAGTILVLAPDHPYVPTRIGDHERQPHWRERLRRDKSVRKISDVSSLERHLPRW
jgi:hypothetical protein